MVALNWIRHWLFVEIRVNSGRIFSGLFSLLVLFDGSRLISRMGRFSSSLSPPLEKVVFREDVTERCFRAGLSVVNFAMITQ